MTTIRTRIDESMPVAFEDVTAAQDAVWPLEAETTDGTIIATTEDFILLMLAVSASPHRTIHTWPVPRIPRQLWLDDQTGRTLAHRLLLSKGRI